MDINEWQAWLPIALIVAIVIAALFLIWLIVLSVKLHQLRRLLNLIEDIAPGQPLDHLLDTLITLQRESQSRIEALEKGHHQLAREVGRCLRRVGLVRFDAFSDVAGEQSFAVALLDDNGDGVVVTSLSGRNESRCYAKPIRNLSSSYRLSEEETEAIKKAMGSDSGVRVT
ncbi:MAG: DUF4446 family protein [Armatimonadetes bacterium]|nr:DUF4446 family protein [Armatimonadota bacterium]MDW8122207.1 DUF4446 family protein [Armatimonadota bacterium]